MRGWGAWSGRGSTAVCVGAAGLGGGEKERAIGCGSKGDGSSLRCAGVGGFAGGVGDLKLQENGPALALAPALCPRSHMVRQAGWLGLLLRTRLAWPAPAPGPRPAFSTEVTEASVLVQVGDPARHYYLFIIMTPLLYSLACWALLFSSCPRVRAGWPGLLP